MVMKCKELEIAKPTAVASAVIGVIGPVCACACVLVTGGLGAEICSCQCRLLLPRACVM